MNGYRVKTSAPEAMLVDWILTMHTYSPDYLEYLMKPDVQQMRYQAGRIFHRRSSARTKPELNSVFFYDRL